MLTAFALAACIGIIIGIVGTVTVATYIDERSARDPQFKKKIDMLIELMENEPVNH